MCPRRYLGYNAAKGSVLVELRKHHIGADVPGTVDHRRGGLVATRLDAEDDWFERPVDHGYIRPFLALWPGLHRQTMDDQSKAAALIRIGTRGSKLALAQAIELCARLAAAHEELSVEGAVEVVVITTTGDAVRDRPLAEIGGKGLFMKEIEEALVAGRVDLALHSMKDVETFLTPGTDIACILAREDPRDAFLSNLADDIDSLPEGAVVGTSSVRRAALVKNRRPDLRTVMYRGNVDTRLAKLEAGEVDATLLAIAGLNRLGLGDRATRVLEVDEMPPAVAQGAIGAQIRISDTAADLRLRDWLVAVNHVDSQVQVTAERAMLATLDGSCRTPIAGHTNLDGAGGLTLTGYVISEDGARLHKVQKSGLASAPEALGRAVGERLLAFTSADLAR
jgi:hydroxymethylbilane synthase